MPETILMVHGMMVGGWCWEKYKSFFEERGYYCIVPDLRFHKLSPAGLPHPQLATLSLLDYVKDLEDQINRLGAIPIIMGHSMGGLLAQILGSRGLAKALVLLSPASPRGIVGIRPSVVKTFWSAMRQPGFWRKPFRLTFDEVTYSMLQLEPVEEQKRLYSRLGYESGKAATEIAFWYFDRKRASEVDASKINVPVLVVSANLDKATPPSVVKKIARKYGEHANYREFINHSHWIIGEPDWQEPVGYVAEWLNKVLGKGKQ